MAIQELEQLDSILITPKKKNNDQHQSPRGRKRKASNKLDKWDFAEVLETRTTKEKSPESSPTFYRKVFVTAIVHHEENASPKPTIPTSTRCFSPVSDTDLSQLLSISKKLPVLINFDEIITISEDS